MRKLFIILVGLIAIFTFIRVFDNFGGLTMEVHAEGSEILSPEQRHVLAE